MQKWRKALMPVWKGLCILILSGGALLLGGCGQEAGGTVQNGQEMGTRSGSEISILENARDSSPAAGGEEAALAAQTDEILVYGETALSLPETTENVCDLREVQGQVLLVTDQGLFTSSDRGDTWVKEAQFPEAEYTKAAISPLGEVAWCNGTEVITVWSPEGGQRELHSAFPDNKSCYTMEYLSENRLLLMDTSSNVQVLDTAEDKITGTVPADNGYHLLVSAVNEKILVWNMDGGVQLFDAGGENPEPCDLAEQLFAQADNTGLGVGSYGVVAADSENTGFFYAGRRGLFHYTLGGSVTEQLIEGEQTVMGDNNYNIEKLAPLSDGGFLVAYIELDSMSCSLKRYDTRSEKELENRVELTLYTLYDSELLRQEVNKLMQQNPECVISVEVGVTGENGVTAEDAVKTLNTEIMAGEGPDLMLLDGIAVEPYIEKGILADLSEVVEQVDEEEGLARNITDTYALREGIYAVPARFLMPMVMGEQTDIAEITDLASLEAWVKQQKAERPEQTSVLGMYGRTYLEILFDLCGPSWITEQGVDQEKLEEFLEAAKRIQDVQQEGVSQADIEEVTKISDYYGRDSSDAEIEWTAQVKYHHLELGLFYSRSFNGAMVMLTASQSFDLARIQSSHVFVPREIIGVNAAGEHVEQAKEFVRSFLSSPCQSQLVLADMAHPVNKTAQREAMESELNAKERLESWLEDSDATEETVRAGFERLMGMIEELETCAVNDGVVRDIVLECGMNYLEGRESLEQAVNAIVQGLELRMAE